MKSILIPTDFSSGARNAMRYGIMLAKRTGARALFFHVSYFSEGSGRKGVNYEVARQSALAASEVRLKKEAEVVMKEMKLRTSAFKHGYLVHFAPFVSDAIIQVAAEKKVSLIVAGTHGATGIRKVLFGSNTTRLISESDVPVLALPLSYKKLELKEFFYSTDLSNPGDELRRVKSFTAKAKVPIHTIFVDYGWEKTHADVRAIEKIKKSGNRFSIVKANLEHNLPEVLNRFMKRQSSSVLCLFHEKRKSLIGTILFGNKTNEIALNLKFPLLAFPKKKVKA